MSVEHEFNYPLTVLAREIHQEQVDKGFYDDGDLPEFVNVDQKLMLIVGEVAEAHEELRSSTDIHHHYHRADGKPEGFAFELADVLIRTLDLAAAVGIDIGFAVEVKRGYNRQRPHKHGRKF